MPADLENSAVATRLEKVFSFQSQRKAMPKNVQTTAQLYSSHMLAKECSKFSKPGSLGISNFLEEISAATAAKLLQSCPTLCNPVDGSPPGSSVHGILQARTLEWVAISSSNA